MLGKQWEREEYMSSWNPELYLKFKEQRTQPARDLISRIDLKYPERILDIGCGPGNSSKELKNRWIKAEILGLDSSETMISKAISDYPGINFVLADATGQLGYLGKFDIIFSNAAVQWMPGIDVLLPNLFSMLIPGGIMAMQIPNPSTMPIQIAVDQASADEKWVNKFNSFHNGLFLHEPGYYFDILNELSDDINLWETHYHHIMPDHESIIDWYSSTGMKPYLDLLEEDEKEQFRSKVLDIIRQEYPLQRNTNVLFKFRRIFFTAEKI